jgi:hypothetical protein
VDQHIFESLNQGAHVGFEVFTAVFLGVGLVRTNVSEEDIASIFRAETSVSEGKHSRRWTS